MIGSNRTLRISVLLVLSLTSLGVSPTWSQTPVPTFDARADLDENGTINAIDLLIFQAAWMATTMSSQTPTLTPTATPTPSSTTPTATFTPSNTGTETPTPTPTTTSNLPGSVSGKITNQQTSQAVAFYPLAIVPDGMIGQSVLSNFSGDYAIGGFPVGVSATIRNNDNPPESRGFQAFEQRFTIRENTVINLRLVPLPPTPTATFTFTPTETFTPSNTPTITPTFTPSNTPTITDTPTFMPTHTFTPTPSNTATHTPTNTRTPTPTATPSNTRTPTPTPVNFDGALWAGTASLNNPIQPGIAISLEGSGSNVIVTFISSRTYIDPPNIVGNTFSFGPEQDSQGAGTQLELKNATFTLLGNRLSGSVEYYTTTGSLRTGTFTMDRLN